MTNDALEYTGARWQPTGLYVSESRGHMVVNGDVDIAVRGTAVITNTYNGAGDVTPDELSSISLLGDHTKIMTPFQEEAFVEGFGKFIEPNYSLASYGGTVNVNVKDQVAQNGKVEIVGNVISMKRSSGTYTPDVYQDGRINIGLTTGDSYWRGLIDNANLAQTSPTEKDKYGHPKYDPAIPPVDADHSGEVNLWLQNGAQWIYENASRKDGLDYKHMPEYSQSSYGSYDGMSHLSRLVGGKDSASAGIIRVKDNDPIQIAEAEGVTKVWYEHADAAPGTIIGGDVKVLTAKTGTEMMLYTGNNGITKGLAEGDAAADKNNVSEVLNSLAHKLWYMAGDSNLKGSVSIAEGLTASSATMKTGNITFAEGGQGFYAYTVKDDSVITDRITGDLDKKYVNLGIETEKGIYNFTQDTVINVTKGDYYSFGLGAIESSGGPITINAGGKNLDVSYHVRKGSDVARAVATPINSGKSKDVTITAKSLKLSTDTTGFRAQGVYATGGKIIIDADTTISASAQTESNGIYSSTGGTVTMSGNLTIQKDSKAANYIALKSDYNGKINVNMKDGKAGAGIVKIDGDVFTKSEESYDYDDDETTSTSSTVNLALQGKDSSWNGRSLYEVTSGDNSTSYGTFNLWLTDGATWTNEKNGKEVPSGFTGSHVTKLTGGSEAAHAGNIFQNDSKNLTIDNYSGNTNIFYAHTGNGEAASDYAAGDTIIKSAAAGSQISLITGNNEVAMDNEYSVANVLNALAGKLTYSAYATGERNLTGFVKIADGLTASSVAMQTGNIAFSDKDGKGSLAEGTVTPGVTYPEEQVKDTYTQAITGITKDDYIYKQNGVLKEEGKYTFTKDPTKIEVESGAAVEATDKNINIDTTKAKLELKGETGIHANGADVTVNGNTGISGKVGIDAANGNVTLNGSTDIVGTDAAINAGEGGNVDINTNNSALNIKGDINADGGSIIVDSSKATGVIDGDVSASNGGSV
ncbi:MAG: hypothetical protein JNG41_02105, partial [Dialister sp.]|nr:hypothetical protein [Dialister sp.]